MQVIGSLIFLFAIVAVIIFILRFMFIKYISCNIVYVTPLFIRATFRADTLDRIVVERLQVEGARYAHTKNQLCFYDTSKRRFVVRGYTYKNIVDDVAYKTTIPSDIKRILDNYNLTVIYAADPVSNNIFMKVE